MSDLVKPFDRLCKETVLSAFCASDTHSDDGEQLTKPLLEAVETIMTWAQSEDGTSAIMWLDGDAGFGKTTVTRAVIGRCKELRILAASFLFCLSKDMCNNSGKFISTLTYQVAINIPGCRPYIEAAIDADPTIFRRSLDSQLVYLIVDNLKRFCDDHGSPGTPYVIAIDALDECRDSGVQKSIIQALINVAQMEGVPVRFLLTSRPEAHIISTFDFSGHPFPETVHLSLTNELGRKKYVPNASIPSPHPDITFASWIWTWETPYNSPPVGLRPFRKTVVIPNGCFVDSLTIDIFVDDIFALYVNGKIVGSGTQWTLGHRWCITFPPTNRLLLAVCATNDPRWGNAAGLIATGVLWDSAEFKGDFYYTFKTDGSWKSLDVPGPPGFERVSFDDSEWNLARDQGRCGGALWALSDMVIPTEIEAIGEGFTGFAGIPDAPAAPLAIAGIRNAAAVLHTIHIPDLSLADWIWTKERPHQNPPIGPRQFRKTVILPAGKYVDSLVIDAACDDVYTLYVNGNVLGFGLLWPIARRWSITFPRTDKLVITVYASNDPIGRSYAGFLAAAAMWDSTNARGWCHRIQTDVSWVYGGPSAWNGLEQHGFAEDDSQKVRVQGRYGVGPWGYVPKPTVISPITEGWKGISGLPNPPIAALATAGQGSSHTIFL